MLKSKYIINNIEKVLTNKILNILMLIIFLVFGFLSAKINNDGNYINSLIVGLSYQPFITLCVLPCIILSNLLMINVFEKSEYLIIRFGTQKEYIKELLKNILVINSIMLFVILIIILIFLNFSSNTNFSGFIHKIYGISNYIYLVFIVLKQFILLNLFSIFFVLTSKLLKKMVSVIISLFFAASLYFIPFKGYYVVSNIIMMPKYLGNYLVDKNIYSNFEIYILSTIIIIVVMIFFNYLLFRLTVNSEIEVSE